MTVPLISREGSGVTADASWTALATLRPNVCQRAIWGADILLPFHGPGRAGEQSMYNDALLDFDCNNRRTREKTSDRRNLEPSMLTTQRGVSKKSHFRAREVVTRLLAVVVALLGVLGAVSTAHADTNDDKFLALLKSEGITDHVSPQHAIDAAHSVCQKLDEGATPTAVANDVLNSSTMPAYQCGYFVGAAIEVYCPQYTPEEGPGENPPT